MGAAQELVAFTKREPADDGRLRQAAELLESQWPTRATDGGGLARRMKQMAPDTRREGVSYALFEAGGCVGTFRVQRASPTPGEVACAVTSVCVPRALRGRGIGQALMRHAEDVAAARGCCYIYLWTPDAARFYEKCGYTRCASVPIARPVLDLLGKTSATTGGEADFITKLEGLFAKTARSAAAEALSADTGCGQDPGDVWLRRRLVEVHRHPPRDVAAARAAIAEELHWLLRGGAQQPGQAPPPASASTTSAPPPPPPPPPPVALAPPPPPPPPPTSTAAVLPPPPPPATAAPARPAPAAPAPVKKPAAPRLPSTRLPQGRYNAYLRPAPWVQQVGPNCGMAALYAAAAALGAGVPASRFPLLSAAQDRHCSYEGELFDVEDAAALARSVLGLRAVVADAGAAGVADAIFRGGVVLYPYDASAGTFRPDVYGGSRAHYALLTGVLWRAEGAGGEDGGDDAPPLAMRWFAPDDAAAAAASWEAAGAGGRCFVAQHSAKQALLVAPHGEWGASNAQLHRPKADDAAGAMWVTRMNLKGLCVVLTLP